jgi:fumarylacetoacetase
VGEERVTADAWVDIAADSPFPVDNLPYGVFSRPGQQARVGVAVGGYVLDVAAVLDDPVFSTASLNPFMALGPRAWATTRERLVDLLTRPDARRSVEPHLVPADDVLLHLPFEVADYVDFYASLHHAENLGRILRPDDEPLTPNWRHLPLGYHGRAGTVVVSGTPVVRPAGQRREPGDHGPVFGPSTRLDMEAEVGFVVGVGSSLGVPVPVADFAQHVFGVVLVNDWSARDLQSWEYVPLGPFLGKSFATTISPWVVPLAALEGARVPGPRQDPLPLPYLADAEGWGLDLALEVRLNGEVISRPPFATTYWTAAQQLAHLTANGARLRTGDLYASGTVSGARPDERGSLIELTWNGTEPLTLADGSTRTFLEDGDDVVITASAPGPAGGRLGLGEVSGTVQRCPWG